VVQVVGVRGAGKTSLLSRWHAATGGRYHWVPPTPARWRLLPCAPIVYWDEADRVPPVVLLVSLLRARRAGATLVLGTHADLTRPVRRAGLPLHTVTLPCPTADTVMAWAALRIAAACLPGEAPAKLRLDTATAAQIASSCGGSWRVVGDRLHAWAADAGVTAGAVESLA
jgi:hypothetical protein